MLIRFQSPSDRSVWLNPDQIVSVRVFKGNVHIACSNGAEHEVVGKVDEIAAILNDGNGNAETSDAFQLPEGVSADDLRVALELVAKNTEPTKDAGKDTSGDKTPPQTPAGGQAPSNDQGESRSRRR